MLACTFLCGAMRNYSKQTAAGGLVQGGYKLEEKEETMWRRLRIIFFVIRESGDQWSLSTPPPLVTTLFGNLATLYVAKASDNIWTSQEELNSLYF